MYAWWNNEHLYKEQYIHKFPSILCHVHLFVLSLYGGIYGWIFKLKIKGLHVLLILYAVGKFLLCRGGFSDFLLFFSPAS